MFLVVVAGVIAYTWHLINAATGWTGTGSIAMLRPRLWAVVGTAMAAYTAWHHRRWRLVLLGPAAIIYVLLAYVIWIVHGLAGLVTGREPARDKPARYAHVVG
jgi:hypothetical protein